ncbi:MULTISPECIES: hypothetical protein [unclassified Pseudomonas]|uniref:hypothetical protein n=1 Tax=unclassified Pseudomonas TaxID=196821 RepID=UPI0010577BE4|nr:MULTISPECIES: hypothetical protein [unclassified Pseudomonas]
MSLTTDMRGKYNSDKDNIQLEFKNIDEPSGAFSGSLTVPGQDTVDIKGHFSFNNEKKATIMWFSTADASWRLVAPYQAGAAVFEDWDCVKTEKANPDKTSSWHFYKDLSEPGGINSGDLNWASNKPKF